MCQNASCNVSIILSENVKKMAISQLIVPGKECIHDAIGTIGNLLQYV